MLKTKESNKKTEVCPCMRVLNIVGSDIVYCMFHSTEYCGAYDPCAVHDGWTKRDECPLHFTFEEVAEKVRALAEKDGLNVRKVFGINFTSPGKFAPIYKNMADNLAHHTVPFVKNSKTSMDVMHVRITNLDRFTKQGYCWFDRNGEIENSEPFKVGDVGYINLVDPKGKGQSRVVLELFAEDVGVELLDTEFVTTTSAEEVSSKKE